MFDATRILARHIFYPIRTHWPNSNIAQRLNELLHSQNLSADEIQDLQTRKLRTLLIEAYQHIPFYQKRFAECGFNPSSFQSFSDLKRIPRLTKRDIQTQRDEMTHPYVRRSSLFKDRTGGSTGSPLEFFYDRDVSYRRRAATMRHDAWAGWSPGDRVALLWGASRDLKSLGGIRGALKNSVLDRQVILNTANLNSEILRRYHRQLERTKPEIILGYANSLLLFAQYLDELDSVSTLRPNGIISSAELLEPSARTVIERVFGCRVFDRYGSREVGVIASECSAHEGLHVCSERVLLEESIARLDSDRGAGSSLLVTDLDNHAMPLIRYEIGDVGRILDQKCSCGRGLPLMQLTGGRSTDFLIAADGSLVSGASLTIKLIANFPSLHQAQLVQRERGRVAFRIVRSPDYTQDIESTLMAEARTFLGTEMQVDFEYVTSIERTPSGKYRFSVCELDWVSELGPRGHLNH